MILMIIKMKEAGNMRKKKANLISGKMIRNDMMLTGIECFGCRFFKASLRTHVVANPFDPCFICRRKKINEYS